MGDVDEHASSDDPVRVGRDIETRGAAARDGICRPPVVKFVLVRDVTEGVHVSMAVTVKLDSQEVRGEANVARADVHVVRGVHEIKGRIRIVWSRDGVDRDRERYASSAPNERGGSAYLVRREVIQGPALVVRSPAT